MLLIVPGPKPALNSPCRLPVAKISSETRPTKGAMMSLRKIVILPVDSSSGGAFTLLRGKSSIVGRHRSHSSFPSLTPASLGHGPLQPPFTLGWSENSMVLSPPLPKIQFTHLGIPWLQRPSKSHMRWQGPKMTPSVPRSKTLLLAHQS